MNKSRLNGIFPDVLKIAIVKPLFKKGEKNCFNNYRPISLLPTISTHFERAIYFQQYNYFNKNNLLAEQQYGLRHNLLDLQDLLAENVTSQSQADRVNRNA